MDLATTVAGTRKCQPASRARPQALKALMFQCSEGLSKRDFICKPEDLETLEISISSQGPLNAPLFCVESPTAVSHRARPPTLTSTAECAWSF